MLISPLPWAIPLKQSLERDGNGIEVVKKINVGGEEANSYPNAGYVYRGEEVCDCYRLVLRRLQRVCRYVML